MLSYTSISLGAYYETRATSAAATCYWLLLEATVTGEQQTN